MYLAIPKEPRRLSSFFEDPPLSDNIYNIEEPEIEGGIFHVLK